MTLLVVDDDPIILRLMEGVLASLGYSDVHFALNADEAMQLVNRKDLSFSTIYLDILMPGMNGIELCRQIRTISRYRRVPITMLTSVTEKASIDASFVAGATDYINKPIDVVELGARLRVSQMLYTEQKLAEETRNLANVLRSELDASASSGVPAFDLSDPITIYEVPRVINALAMENYLHRLSRGRRFMLGAIGFQIRKVETLYARSTPSGFQEILTDVAEAIFENLRAHDAMISYYGNGSFVAIVPRVSRIAREDLEIALSATLAEFGLTVEGGLPMNVVLSVGDLVQSSMFETDPKKLVARAIDRACAAHPARYGADLMNSSFG
ncbi:MAG: response regulator [Paracoccaceae bacterium]|nr:response regulator [Paracoccaceae bacterium]